MTPTRTEAPASQMGSSVTTFTADDLDRRQRQLIADLISASPDAMVMRSGGAESALFAYPALCRTVRAGFRVRF